MIPFIDVDQHLFEPREMWRDHIDPDRPDRALAIDDDDLGYPWPTCERPFSPRCSPRQAKGGRRHVPGGSRAAYRQSIGTTQ